MTAARPRSNGVARVEAARRRVRPFAALAVIALLSGLWGGLARIGWSIPTSDALVLRQELSLGPSSVRRAGQVSGRPPHIVAA